MLFTIALWLLLGSISSIIGIRILHWANASCIKRRGDRLFIALWSGTLSLSIVLLVASFFWPLSPVTGGIVSFLLIVFSLCDRKTRKELFEVLLQILNLSWKSKIFLLFLILFTASLTSQKVTLYDTGLYHYQAIKWFSEFGTVPGLGLIHYRFATNSSWLALVAPFNAGIFETRVCSLLGGFAAFIMLGYCFICILRILRHNEEYADWFACLSYFICLPVIFLSTLPNSISPDLPIIFLIIVIAWLFVLLSTHYTSKPLNDSMLINPYIIPLFLASCSVTIKLSALPLFLMTLIIFVFVNRYSIKRIIIGFLISILLISTILTFNLIVSGFFLYPASFFFLDLPWSFDPEQAKSYTHIIQEWARWNRPTPSYGNSWNWIFPWLGYERQFVFSIICNFASFAFLFAYHPKIKGKNHIILLSGVGIIYVLVTAPALRFALGYLCLLPAFILADFCYRNSRTGALSIFVISGIVNSWIGFSITYIFIFSMTAIATITVFLFYQRIPRILFFIVLLFLCLVITSRSYLLDRDYQFNLVLPPKLENQNKAPFLHKQVRDISYLSPDINYHYEESPGFIRREDRCWDAELPCTPYLTHQNIRLRDPKKGLAGGFERIYTH